MRGPIRASDGDIEGMRVDHQQSEKRPDECYACGSEWPCDVSTLVDDWLTWQEAVDTHRGRAHYWQHQAKLLGWTKEIK
jgi:hypothetical protein